MRGYLNLLKGITVRAPQDQERPLYLVRAWGVAAGSLLLSGACLYRRIRHPDWTGGQAVAVLWPVYLVGVLSIFSGWIFRDANGKQHTPAAREGKNGPDAYYPRHRTREGLGIVSCLDPSQSDRNDVPEKSAAVMP